MAISFLCKALFAIRSDSAAFVAAEFYRFSLIYQKAKVLSLDPQTLEAAFQTLEQKITPTYQRPSQGNHSADARESHKKMKSL